MKKRVYLAIGLHFHQPVGNFENILERSYENCYRPFLEVFSRYPSIKMTFHFSGNLLDYFEEKHPEFIDRVKAMVESGQVEIMGGGYYEPIFQAIPQRDRLGQIEMLSSYIEKRFGARPKGMWMPERVWSPELTGDFQKCGILYSILDDIHLIRAGVSQRDKYGYFMTGKKDSKLAIFPSDKTLRYIIPFKSPRETTAYLKGLAQKRGELLLTYGDDGEKFGEWPWTHDWVYKKGWLDNFFKELVRDQSWVKVVTFSEYLDSHPPVMDVHIPEAAYEEMLEWSGGSWMNYLSRYPESNQMHKRMSYVSDRISRLEAGKEDLETRERLNQAKKELYKGQTNCPYWHGVFGGIYLYHLRKAVFEHIIEADRIADEIEHRDNPDWVNVKEMDFYDGDIKAVVLEDRDFFISIDPANGGVIRELDYKRWSLNLVNTLARHRETYHKKILDRINHRANESILIHEAMKTMDARIKSGIFYDRFMRTCLLDHFIEKGLKKEDFEECNYIEKGDFADGLYAVMLENKRAILSREGSVDAKRILITKEIGIFSDAEIKILYTLRNKTSATIDNLFGVEFNITLASGETDRHAYEGNSFSLRDSQGDSTLRLVFSEIPEKLWHFPVMTVSQSERAYDLSYQSTCIFPMWDIRLGAGEEARLCIAWIMK